MEVIEKRVRVAVGLNETARKLGITRGHLSLVIHRHRPAGKKLAKKLSDMGFDVLVYKKGVTP